MTHFLSFVQFRFSSYFPFTPEHGGFSGKFDYCKLILQQMMEVDPVILGPPRKTEVFAFMYLHLLLMPSSCQNAVINCAMSQGLVRHKTVHQCIRLYVVTKYCDFSYVTLVQQRSYLQITSFLQYMLHFIAL